ncbi:MAG: DUF4290 domain-containing protein [Bacteroidales bacterium]|nr:DUF4290 domain-containing protein [Bacteroidales bacterium]
MENPSDSVKLYYNTEMEKLAMPEYGRNVRRMVETVKAIPDRARRSEQAAAVVKVMEILNPQVRQQENYEQKLWDHLFFIAGPDLDIDSPYPAPEEKFLETKPVPIPLKNKPVKANHYGRNIESIIDLIASEPEGEEKTAMLRDLATYMRQQYLIWNKDSVADETIFKDIEKLSDYRIRVPEGLQLSKISFDANFSRPGMSMNVGQAVSKKKDRKSYGRHNYKKK